MGGGEREGAGENENERERERLPPPGEGSIDRVGLLRSHLIFDDGSDGGEVVERDDLDGLHSGQKGDGGEAEVRRMSGGARGQ